MTEVLQRVMKVAYDRRCLASGGAVAFITELIEIYIQFGLENNLFSLVNILSKAWLVPTRGVTSGSLAGKAVTDHGLSSPDNPLATDRRG